MKRIYILGVNGNARDIVEAIQLIREVDPVFPEVGGFLDDHVKKGIRVDGVQVYGPLRSAVKLRGACFVNAIGSPSSYQLKAEIIAKTGVSDSSFISIIHPRATISKSAKIGTGSVILSSTSIGADVSIGKHSMILQNCVVSHDSRVRDYASIATGVCLSGHVHVGKSVYIGSHACVRGNLHIGDKSLIGMGSVVVKNIPAGGVWCGNPARYLRSASV